MDALTFLGTGGGIPMTDRVHSSILLESGGRRWLLDAGEPCSQRLKAMGVPFASLDAIFISHGHSDHLSGLPMIIQGAWLEPRRRPLPLYLPAELINPIRTWLEAVYLPEKLVGFAVEYHPWESFPGRAVTIDEGQLRVSVNSSTHLDGQREKIDPSAADRFLAYSIVYDWLHAGKRLIYSADLGRPEDLVPVLDRPCDLLICELAHFEPEELFVFLADKPVRRVCLTHFTAEFAARLEEICELGREMLPKTMGIMAMADGERVEF